MLPDLFKRLKPIYGIAIDKLWIEYQTADPERRRDIDELLLLLAVRRLKTALGNERIVLEPPHPTLVSEGSFELGSIQYPGLAPFPVALRHEDLLRHIFVLGPTGTGKSTLILGLLMQLLRDKAPFCIFDFKRNYRALLALKQSTQVMVFTVGRDVAPLALNVMRPPPLVSIPAWVEALTDIVSSAYLLLQGARNVLKEALLQTFDAHEHRATLRHTYELLVS